MAYILAKDRLQNSNEEWQSCWSAYCTYLESVKDLLPRSAFEFASASWHYDFSDHRSPHDAWLEEVVIRASASGERKENRSLEILARLFAAYHDGHIELRYSEVRDYSLTSGVSVEMGHGDWRYDEIRLSNQSRRVLHEVEWSGGGLWVIECGDVSYRWIPLSHLESAS